MSVVADNRRKQYAEVFQKSSLFCNSSTAHTLFITESKFVSMEDSEKERIFPFGESDFIVDNFNPEQFLAKYSATCDLENLKSDLAAFLSQCESAIMSIMNKDYQSFISLALRLNGLKEKMENIRSPLVDNKDRLQQHKEDLIKECEVLSNLLKRYQLIEAKKQSLTQFLRIHTIITQSVAIYNTATCFISNLTRSSVTKIRCNWR